MGERFTSMSHHFDTAVAKDDSRLNILDVYLFDGADPGTTAMILTTNPDAGIFAPLTLHPEGLYAFRLDTDGDGVENIAFKFLFDEPSHVGDDHSEHRQRFRVLAATGTDIAGDGGDLLAHGNIGETVSGAAGVHAYVGRAAELWAADAFGFFTLVNAMFTENRYASEAFEHCNNLFAGRNNMATVLQIPNTLLGGARVGAWATASLFGHAPEAQVYRWGLPLFTHLYLSDPAYAGLADRFHTSTPTDDGALFTDATRSLITTLSELAGHTADTGDYADRLLGRLVPAVLPYQVGTPAYFGVERFNGRPLHADAFDVMLSLAANTVVADGVSPDIGRIRPGFPYCGQPYSATDQQGMRPLRELIGLSY
jgi:hypothetical protein